VHLERLRKKAKHPRFESQYSEPIPVPPPIEAPPEPVYVEPEPPKGLGSVFGGKKKYAEAVVAAQAAFAQAYQQWQQAVAAVPMQQLAQLAEHNRWSLSASSRRWSRCRRRSTTSMAVAPSGSAR
jgi:restriction system protein